ncbi:hypothetical protein N7466_008241 [Penicillium verhagenii]|uniref:uncharacterized protein n=1 Tax=Penicillium verhagenii TaxID=1562060 RepID=UPI0025455A7B|nr:uncharacterized protein N7466_008241 [Penicillium verhagenii]KAJ5924054.1 hypothetical protein N7466_008241 [Penicillium verhagenii]
MAPNPCQRFLLLLLGVLTLFPVVNSRLPPPNPTTSVSTSFPSTPTPSPSPIHSDLAALPDESAHQEQLDDLLDYLLRLIEAFQQQLDDFDDYLLWLRENFPEQFNTSNNHLLWLGGNADPEVASQNSEDSDSSTNDPVQPTNSPLEYNSADSERNSVLFYHPNSLDELFGANYSESDDSSNYAVFAYSLPHYRGLPTIFEEDEDSDNGEFDYSLRGLPTVFEEDEDSDDGEFDSSLPYYRGLPTIFEEDEDYDNGDSHNSNTEGRSGHSPDQNGVNGDSHNSPTEGRSSYSPDQNRVNSDSHDNTSPHYPEESHNSVNGFNSHSHYSTPTVRILEPRETPPSGYSQELPNGVNGYFHNSHTEGRSGDSQENQNSVNGDSGSSSPSVFFLEPGETTPSGYSEESEEPQIVVNGIFHNSHTEGRSDYSQGSQIDDNGDSHDRTTPQYPEESHNSINGFNSHSHYSTPTVRILQPRETTPSGYTEESKESQTDDNSDSEESEESQIDDNSDSDEDKNGDDSDDGDDSDTEGACDSSKEDQNSHDRDSDSNNSEGRSDSPEGDQESHDSDSGGSDSEGRSGYSKEYDTDNDCDPDGSNTKGPSDSSEESQSSGRDHFGSQNHSADGSQQELPSLSHYTGGNIPSPEFFKSVITESPTIADMASKSKEEQPSGSFHQDYIASMRYRNDLPPPDMPPKFLDIPHEGLSRFLTPGFASNLARREEPNIDVDAEGGMPIDLVGIPGLHLGDESAIMAPENPQPIDPADLPLLMPLDQLRHPAPKNTNVSFLRRTQHISVERSAPSISGTTLVANQTRSIKKAKVSLDDPKNVKKLVQKGFDVFYPESKYTGEDTESRVRGLPATKAELDAWANPVHPDNPKLKFVGFFPVLPDLDGFTDPGGLVQFKFDKAPVSAVGGKRDKRMDVALLHPSAPEERICEEHAQKAALHKANPEVYPDPGPVPWDYDLFLSEKSESVPKIATSMDPKHPNRDNDDLYGHEGAEGNKFHRYDRVRTYATSAQTINTDNKQRDIALTMFEPTEGKDKQQAAYYYCILGKTRLKPERARTIAQAGLAPTASQVKEDQVDQMQVAVRDPDESEVYKRALHRANIDPEFAKTLGPPPEPPVAEEGEEEVAEQADSPDDEAGDQMSDE